MGSGWKEWVSGSLSFPLSVFICFLAIMMLCCTFLLGRFASLQSLLELFQVRTTGQVTARDAPIPFWGPLHFLGLNSSGPDSFLLPSCVYSSPAIVANGQDVPFFGKIRLAQLYSLT